MNGQHAEPPGLAEELKVPTLTRMIHEMIHDERVVSVRYVSGAYIATAIPLQFDGGPVPDAWRAEGAGVEDAIEAVFDTYRQIPRTAQWDNDGELRWPKGGGA